MARNLDTPMAASGAAASGGAAVACVLAAGMLFGTTGTARSLGPAAAASTVGAARLVVAGAVLVAVSGIAARRSAAGGRWPLGLVAVSALAVAAFQVLFFSALGRTGVAVGTVVAIGCGPVFTGALSAAVGAGRPGLGWALATAAAIAGCALLVLSGGDGELDAFGIVLALGAAAAYATYTVTSKQLIDRGHSSTAVMAAAFGGGGLLLAPILLAGDAGWLATTDGLLLALYLGCVPTAAAYLLYGRGLQRLDAGSVTTFTLVEPVTAAILGVLVLSERLSATAALGALLVLAALGGASLDAVLRTRSPTARAGPGSSSTAR